VKIHTKRKHGYACTLRGETKLKRRSNEVGGTALSEGFFLLCQIFRTTQENFRFSLVTSTTGSAYHVVCLCSLFRKQGERTYYEITDVRAGFVGIYTAAAFGTNFPEKIALIFGDTRIFLYKIV